MGNFSFLFDVYYKYLQWRKKRMQKYKNVDKSSLFSEAPTTKQKVI